MEVAKMHHHLKQIVNQVKKQAIFNQKIKLRQHLNADALIACMREEFDKVPEHRQGTCKISLPDALMSAFAMFALKDPSLLAFDQRRRKEPENLHSVFGITNIPCDTQMREICDGVDPIYLHSPFRAAFSHCQRGKLLEQMTFLGQYYIVSGDGTGYYYSENVSSPSCLEKKRSNGNTAYYQQMYAAAIVHPDRKEVIALCPEMIRKQDGTTKGDCERNAARRFFEQFRREHPHLKVIVTEDGLSPNAPHIKDLQRLGLHFILSVKPGDHAYLFDQMDAAIKAGTAIDYDCQDGKDAKIHHHFRYVNDLPLNQSSQDVRVNLLEYWEDKDGEITRFSWVTDIKITSENVYQIMRAGRARWKIENETFNTLKNQGYNLEHNYGLGKQHLSEVFALLMMLAFLVDQIQQMGCSLFQAAWKQAESKKALWEKVRHLFHSFTVDSMETIYRAIALGFKRNSLREACET
jgi:hypothetical protein